MQFCSLCNVALQENEDGTSECFRCGKKYDRDGNLTNESDATAINQKLEEDYQTIQHLRELFPASAQTAVAKKAKSTTCPRCGSSRLRTESSWFSKLIGKSSCICLKCGAHWKA